MQRWTRSLLTTLPLIASAMAQCAELEADLSATKGQLEDVQVALKGVAIAVPIVAVCLISILVVVLVIVLRKVSKIKKLLPGKIKTMGLISFLRNLGKF